jgi:hypothetical protein
MTGHWYEDGYFVAIPFAIFTYLPMAWVLIFRPTWADKILGRMIRITPERGKFIGALMLLGFVLALAGIAEHLVPRN